MSYRAFRDSDLVTVGPLMATSFTCSEEDVPEWHQRVGVENIRVFEKDNEVAASLVLIHMAQFFNGKSIPMLGIAGVGTAPEYRGRGVCREMMRECLGEAHQAGTPLSTLYPATFNLYRSVGYEMAGYRVESKVPLNLFPRANSDSDLSLHRFQDQDLGSVKACYENYATSMNGYLDRTEVIWRRIFNPWKQQPEVWVLKNSGGDVEAYISYVAKRKDLDFGVTYKIQDAVACSGQGWRALAGFLKSLYSMGGEAIWPSGVQSPLIDLLPERGWKREIWEEWMLRIVNVEQALLQRGWSPSISGETCFSLKDDVIQENNGTWSLRIDAGVPRVERGGSPSFDISINGLAALYSGHQTAEHLQLNGHLNLRGESGGGADALMLASSLFACSAPGMPDMF